MPYALFVDLFISYLAAFWHILAETAPWLLAGLVLAGIAHAVIPQGMVTRALGGSGLGPIVRASLLGLPLPLCSCSVIPVAAQLRRAGAGRGATAAFTVSTPQTGEESIPLTWALLGPWFALARPIAAVATALATGLLVDRFAPDRAAAETPESSCGCSSKPAASDPATKPCCASRPKGPTLAVRALAALRHALVTLPADIAVWLIIGLALAAGVAALVPENAIAALPGGAVTAYLGALVLGIPLYICSTSSTPLAAALVAAGLSPGAALVMLLVGPATNTTTIVWLWKALGPRALVIYLATIAAGAVLAGIGLDLMPISINPATGAHDHATVGLFPAISAVGLAALLLWHAVAKAVRWWRSRRADPPADGIRIATISAD